MWILHSVTLEFCLCVGAYPVPEGPRQDRSHELGAELCGPRLHRAQAYAACKGAATHHGETAQGGAMNRMGYYWDKP